MFFNRIRVRVTIYGAVGGRLVRFDDTISIPKNATVASVLKSAGRLAGIDLLQAMAAGAQPAIMLNGKRTEDLSLPVSNGAHISWLLPMAGG